MSSDDTLATPAAVETVDTTVAPTPEDFDFEAWLGGVRATRRSVKVYARADLVGRMEEVAATYRDDLPAAAKRKIEADVLALRAEFEESGRWFTLEARSSEWVKDFRAETARRLKLDVGDESADVADLSPEQVRAREAVTLEQVAAQTVVPSGVTSAMLARMQSVAETEVSKLVVAMVMANSQQAQSAAVLTRDFSRSRSDKVGTAGSRRR